MPGFAKSIISDFRTGSSLPVLVETSGGKKCVIKWKGTGEGPLANAVDWTGLHLARAAGIPVPAPHLITITTGLVDTHRDPDINDLIIRSVGTNLGIEFLENAVPFGAHHTGTIDPALRNMIYLFDVLFLNIDRTDHNPNMLVQGSKLFCIDFAATMSVKMLLTGMNYSETTLLPLIRRHPFYSPMGQVDATFDLHIEEAIRTMPDEWLTEPAATRERLFTGLTALLAQSQSILQRRISLLDKLSPESPEQRTLRTLNNRRAFEETLKKYGGVL